MTQYRRLPGQSPRPATPTPTQPAENKLTELLQPLLRRLQIPNWDAVLIGDGSGCHWHLGIGWACTLLDRQSGGRKLFYGAASHGTASLAEALAYLAPLQWYHYHREKKALTGMARIHIVTDNKALADQSRHHRNGQTPKHNQAFWAMLRALERESGFVVYVHHVGREELALNTLADIVAGHARVALSKIQVRGADRPLTDYCHLVTLDEFEPISKLRRP